MQEKREMLESSNTYHLHEREGNDNTMIGIPVNAPITDCVTASDDQTNTNTDLLQNLLTEMQCGSEDFTDLHDALQPFWFVSLWCHHRILPRHAF
jgi:hypothetical protein